jgi:hypothetical protein
VCAEVRTDGRGLALFAQELGHTLLGDIDRNYIPTRIRTSDDDLELLSQA